MTYNLHPIIVHFPIALLFLYSIIKIFPFKKFFPKFSWKHVELVLLVVGFGGALMAIYTGGIARHLLKASGPLVRAHSLFAVMSAWLYGALLLGETLVVVTAWSGEKIKSPQFNFLLVFIKNILTCPLVSKTLALLGLVALAVAGMLGGVMVYGTSADPLAGTVLHLLNINY